MDPTLKQRIVGAAILFGLGAILVPWLLDAPEQTDFAIVVPAIPPSPVVSPARHAVAAGSTALPSPAGSASESAVAKGAAAKHDVTVSGSRPPDAGSKAVAAVPLAPAEATAGGTRSAPAAGKAAPEAGRTAAAAVPIPTTSGDAQRAAGRISAEVPPVKKNKPAAPRADAAPSGWMVQLGLFNDRRNAHALAAKLKARGFVAQVQELQADRAPAFRVRVGPAASASAARVLQQKLLATMGLKGMVIGP